MIVRRIMHVEKPLEDMDGKMKHRATNEYSDDDKYFSGEYKEEITTIHFTDVPEKQESTIIDLSTNGDTSVIIGQDNIEDTDGNNKYEREDVALPYDPKLDFEYYKYATIDLLKKYPDQDAAIDMEEQQANKERIITVLRNFGVEISSIKATVGPTITLYEITPAVGVRIAKIRNLENDIALSLSAIGIRIIAPITG